MKLLVQVSDMQLQYTYTFLLLYFILFLVEFGYREFTIYKLLLINHNISLLDCGDLPTVYSDKLECADGTFADIWDGRLKKDSYRFRCPFPYIPCRDMRVVDGSESKDFHCDLTCSSFGGKRETCNGGQ